jgi:NADH:ubiquinone oxidoreductase subunit E
MIEIATLTEAEKEYLNNLGRFFQTRQSLLLPTLHLVFKKYNYITKKAMEDIAKFLEIEPIKVMEAVSFYHYFQNKENKPYRLKVCTNISCLLKGAKNVYLAAKSYLTTSKNISALVEIEEYECLAACDRAPVAIFQNVYLNYLSEEKITGILNLFEKEGKLPVYRNHI